VARPTLCLTCFPAVLCCAVLSRAVSCYAVQYESVMLLDLLQLGHPNAEQKVRHTYTADLWGSRNHCRGVAVAMLKPCHTRGN